MTKQWLNKQSSKRPNKWSKKWRIKSNKSNCLTNKINFYLFEGEEELISLFVFTNEKVICDPQIQNISIDQENSNSFLIIACDGLWDVVTFQEACDVTWDAFQRGEKNLAEGLVKLALQKKSKDNVSVMVIRLWFIFFLYVWFHKKKFFFQKMQFERVFFW